MSSLCEEPIAEETDSRARIAVVIPCYRVRKQIASVLRQIGPEVSLIYCVDDACPEQSKETIAEFAENDSRIHLIVHQQNQGVGGAVMTGYREAIADGANVIVKLDGDGQMPPGLIPKLVAPILRGEADYVKGNRFYRLEGVRQMPAVRVIGNAGLSFMTKLSTGYWSLFDPTNGLTAIHASSVELLPMEKVCKRYFFESDILFRLNTIRAVVKEIPMDAIYGDEQSSLNVTKTLFEFPLRHSGNFCKRLFYNYFLRNFSLASIELVLGIVLLLFGAYVGIDHWVASSQTGIPASAGTVMLAGLPVLIGIQLGLNFIGFDMNSEPEQPLQNRLSS